MNFNVKQNSSKLAYEGACGSSPQSKEKSKLTEAIGKIVVGTMVGAAMLTPAPFLFAQDDEYVIEEVIVSGIRASLKKSADRKRFADGIIDAINSEDIGKFPDTNLAESLQRITGVSIDRSRGEGSRITVRGLGPDFNLVTFNGRQMPTQSGGGRSFDFANIASEGISAVELYKTSNAILPTGGIGATIDVITTKPLENPGLNVSGGLKFVYDTSAQDGSSFTPELSGIYSNTFAEDTIGVSLSASYQDREHGVNSGGIGSGYRTSLGDAGVLSQDQRDANGISATDIYSAPQNISYQLDDFDRQRTNAQLTLQWDPIDNLRLSVDYTYAQHELSRRYSNFSAWFLDTGQITTFTDGAIASPILYSEINNNNDFAFGIGADSVINENNSIGFNAEWDINDRLSVALDYHDSSAESRPNSALGSNSLLTLASFTRSRTIAHFGDELPILQLALSAPLSVNDVDVTGSVFGNTLNRMDINQTRLSGEFDINETSKVDFGIQLTNVDNRASSSNVQRNTWGGLGRAGEFTDVLTEASIANAFDSISGGDDPRLQTDFITGDINAVIGRLNEIIAADGLAAVSPAGLVQDGVFGDCGTALCASTNYRDSIVEEETTSYYAKYSLSLDELETPINLNVGLRYEETDVSSPALIPSITSINFVSANEFVVTSLRDEDGNLVQTSSEQTGNYDFWLPNVDFNIEFADGLIGRASYSKTVTRPNFDQLNGAFSVSTIARVDGGDASSGNPGLLPYESTNIDLSVEWYYSDDSYASIGYFTKDVNNFIGSGILEDQESFPDLTHPAFGENSYFAQAQAALGGTTDRTAIRDYIFANFADQPGVNAAEGIITGIPSDGVATFDVAVNANINNATINGWEFAVQHNFAESGFGLIANLTLVDSDIAYDNLSVGNQFIVPGISDTYNLIAFYDKNGIQGRVAYNWRDDFISGGGLDPSNVRSFGQFDFSASYDINERLSVTVEGINVTNETFRNSARTESQVFQAAQTGARYNFGVRYKL